MIKTMQVNKQTLFFDDSLMPSLSADFFSSAFWQKQNKVTGTSVGRGTTWFFEHQGQEYVLRHYLRGGMMGKLNRDRYLYTGKDNSRSYREFQLLQTLQDLVLPAPIPAAGRIIRHGLSYQADLIIARIPNSQDLVHILQKQALTAPLWHEIGKVIKRFHQAAVEHTDLNAHNILLDDNEKVWLIDFDRCQIHTHQNKDTQKKWQQANLSRLKRSFIKEINKYPNFYWQMHNWTQLMAGYDADSTIKNSPHA